MTGSDDFAWEYEAAPLHAAEQVAVVRRHQQKSLPAYDTDSGLYDWLLELLEGPEWHRQAACRGMGANLFFPENGMNADGAAARKVCAGCPVRAECREAGMAEVYGIWGGMGGRERRERRNGPRCGTLRGYRWHGYVGEEACDECKAAEAARKRKGAA